MSSDALNIPSAVAALLTALPPESLPAFLHEPEFLGREKELVADCLDTGWVSYAGPRVPEFEAGLARICGRRHAIATTSGTAALHLALMLAGIGRDDEVIIPTLTFVATANAVAYCGAHPHFADSDSKTLGLDTQALGAHLKLIAVRDGEQVINRQTGRRIGAIVPVHVLGHPSEDDGLIALADQWGLPVIVDSTESLGSLRADRPAAAAGLLSVLSFNGNKIITTGGGGAILTDDDELAARARYLSTTAKQPHPWAFVHTELGYNYRMPNLNAAVGLGQLERLDDFVARKRVLAHTWRRICAEIPGLSFFEEPAGSRSNYWLNAVLLDDPACRDDLLAALHAAKLMARPMWELMHNLPMFAEAPRAASLAVAEDLAARLVCLPSSPRLASSPHLASL
ncbi:MAG: LegC family aminotransferase [Rhodospirillaceae bacterium]|nr:LegC family aminotransferase [Rhodospirillales bacterium]